MKGVKLPHLPFFDDQAGKKVDLVAADLIGRIPNFNPHRIFQPFPDQVKGEIIPGIYPAFQPERTGVFDRAAKDVHTVIEPAFLISKGFRFAGKP